MSVSRPLLNIITNSFKKSTKDCVVKQSLAFYVY